MPSMQPSPSTQRKLRQDIAANFLGLEDNAHRLTHRRFDVDGSSCTATHTDLNGLDAEGIAVATNAVDEAIWPYLTTDEQPGLHGHPHSFLALAFLKLKPLNLPPPPLPQRSKMWVPGKFLSKASGNWMARMLMMAGIGLVAGAVIGAAIYLAEPMMKMFGMMGNLLVKAGTALGSALHWYLECLAHPETGGIKGLFTCTFKGLGMLLLGGLKMAVKLGAYGLKMTAKLLGKICMGALAMGGMAMKKFGQGFVWFFKGVGGLALKGLKMLAPAILLGMGWAIKKLAWGAVKGIGMAFKGIGLAFAGIGNMFAAIPKFAMNPFKFVFGGLSLAMGALGKLGAKMPGMPSIKQFFLKGLPKMFSWMLSGPKALMIGIGAGLGGFFSKFPDLGAGIGKLGMGALGGLGMAGKFMIGGLAFGAELAISAGGFVKDLMLDFGDVTLGVLTFGADMALGLLEAGWDFAGSMAKVLGPLVVKFFEGALWLAKFLFDQLGKMVLAGVMLAGKAIMKVGKLALSGAKMLGSLAVGGLKMVGSLFSNPLGKISGFFKSIGSLFKSLAMGGFNLVSGLVGLVGKVGSFAVSLAKVGFGMIGSALTLMVGAIPSLVKGLGIGFGSFFKMLGSGIVLGFNATADAFSKFPKISAKLFHKLTGIKLGKIGMNIMGGLGDLGKMGLGALKATWAKIKGGAIALGLGLKGIGTALGKIGSLDIRWILTGVVLLMYAAYMCFGAGMCQPMYQKPGWGMPGTHSISGLRLPEIGWKFKGGKAKPWGMYRSQDARAGRYPNGEWMKFEAPKVEESQVQADEDAGDRAEKAKIYEEPPAVDWDKKVGDLQTTEIDRTPTIASVDMGNSDEWTAGPNKSAVKGHPTIILNHPATSVRVQMHDMDSGKVNWDSVYFLAKPGRLDATAREVGSGVSAVGPFGGGNAKSYHSSSETPPGGWKSFERMAIPAGDPTAHEYELKITKYPSNAEFSGNDVGEEDNLVGTAHFRLYGVQDPSVPSEKAARRDAAPLKRDVAALSMGMPAVALAALPPDAGQAKRLLPAPLSSPCTTWRTQRHREFWSEPSAPSRLHGAVTSRSSSSNKARHPSSVRRQAHLFL